MNTVSISPEVRARPRSEAGDRCGYCQTPQALAYSALETDHIIPVAAGGRDHIKNLWLACRPCNLYKGTQTYGLDPQSGRRVHLFNPRRQVWHQHFRWSEEGTRIIGLTACGRATVVALNLNNPFAVETRRYWVRAGWYPPREA